MLLASNQFCISQPRAVNFVLPAAHICLNLQPSFNISPSPTCLSCVAKPLPSPAEFFLQLSSKDQSRCLHLLPHQWATPDPSALHEQQFWSTGDLGALIALLADFKVQIARLKLHLLEWPVKFMTCMEQPPLVRSSFYVCKKSGIEENSSASIHQTLSCWQQQNYARPGHWY